MPSKHAKAYYQMERQQFLVYQDQAKKQAFLRQWDAETRPLSE